ncbi:tetratricopeptide repeat protein [Enhygromyxa salina]|uniref:Tetratricopeptide repeat protein n=1 Tax=Enhygromyxa salina TaxID=215803 RepID=A0A2S9XD58_9BACT|nr:tetratricopeptide repeat protein [Enhygromyxa salina]
MLPAESGVMSAQSGVLGQSGVLSRSGGLVDNKDDDPFFSGDPGAMPELGSITQGDASTFANENPAASSGIRDFEFEDDGGPGLELGDIDQTNVPQAPRPAEQATQRPNFDSPDFAGLDLPATSSFDDDDTVAFGAGPSDDFDLPSAGSPGHGTSGPGSYGPDDIDLPMATGATDLELDLPAPSGGGRPELDLPMPSGPAPDGMGPGPGGMGGPGPGVDLPAPDGEMNFDGELSLEDLPMPSDDLGMAADLPMPAADLPMPAADLPMPAADFAAPTDDFPAPADDFPAPADDFPSPEIDLDDGFDSLPTPADMLPTPAEDLPAAVDMLPTPADVLPTPADILPAPVDDLGLDLDVDEPAPARPAPPRPEAVSAPGPATSPAPARPLAGPRVTPKSNTKRYVIYGALAVVVLGVGGGALAMTMGLFDPDPDPGTATQTNDDGADEPAPPPGEPAERAESVLAKFDEDTPASYVQAYERAKANADSIGQAEAALLIHHRYGPDPARLAEAGQLLAVLVGGEEPFVRRVIGLALLASGKTDEALAKLAGDDPRTSLYRAWALLEKGDSEGARVAAEAAGAARPNDQAAQLAALEARFLANPVDGIAAMRQAAEASPNHLALQEALMQAARESGRLGEASQVGQGIQPAAISDTHKAELLRLRAEIAIAQGRSGEAMRLLDQALASDPSLMAARIERIELWLTNKDFTSVWAELDVLLREHPTDPVVLKTAARADLEAGRDDDARARFAALGESAANDPEVKDLLGQAEALLMKIEAARAAFAAARALDPLYTPAVAHEVGLLVRTEQLDPALTLLDAHLEVMNEAGAKDTPRGRRALATVARIRAEILRDKGELQLALTAAEEASASDPASNDALLLRAELLGLLDLQEAHEEALLDLHERTGGYPGLTEPLGKVLLRKGQLDELEKLIGPSLDSPEASREIILTGAALRLAQAKPDQAQALAQKILDRDPTDARAHLLLGRALLALGEHTRALDEIESAQTREGDAEVELWLGQALEYNGRADEARSHYTRSLALDPGKVEAAALLGRLYAYEGAAQKAIELLQPVVKQTDAYPYAYLALGLAHKDMGKRDLAISDFKKAQQLDSTLFEAFYQEGRIHNDQNKHSRAVKALQAGLDNAKDNATERALIDTYRRLGESYQQIGHRGDAKSAFQEYLKLAPASAAGRREVERLLRDL